VADEDFSQPILTGYLNGIAAIIIVGQLPKLVGYPGAAQEFMPRLLEFLQRLDQSHLPTLGLSLTSIVALVIRLTGLPLPLTGRDLNDPEFNTFLILFTAPHLMFGLALMLVAVRLYADGWLAPSAAPRAGRHLGLAITVTLLGLAQPFTLLPLCALIAVHGLAMVAWHRRIEWPGLAAAGVTLLAAGPLVVANAVTFSTVRTNQGQDIAILAGDVKG